MRRELDRAAEAPRLREMANALTQMGDAPAPDELRLPERGTVPLEHAPGESALRAADRLHRTVRSMERALASLPARIGALESKELPRAGVEPNQRARAKRAGRMEVPADSFRTYRSSGGLHIWVGRGARSNDALTFREASPDDIWLHARDDAGAHVVLRWSSDEPPPPRDLEEAAALAAWHSRSRGSAVVPVDWTRRKYVRKPRGATPGAVTLQHAKTVFARPSSEIERRLRYSVFDATR